jgi:hydrogenase maturation protease
MVESLQIGGTVHQTWQEGVEREVVVEELPIGQFADRRAQREFAFPANCRREPLCNAEGEAVGIVLRRQERVEGTVDMLAEEVEDGLLRITVGVANGTGLENATQVGRDEALMRSLVSVHVILSLRNGEFVSLTDPPPQWQRAAADCRNVGTWPVLVGEQGEKDTMLSAPIILYDYPQVAPESPGDLFDCTEIDEMLALRIQTLTEDEKHAMAAVDAQTRALLARTEELRNDQLLGLHGAVRGLRTVAGDER